jgi:hypothetical protein
MPGAQDQSQQPEAGGQSAPAESSTDERLEALYPVDVPDPAATGAAEGGEKPAERPDEKPTEADTSAAGSQYLLTPPEGYVITPEILREVTPVFREIGLNNDQANKLMPLAGNFVERILDQQQDEFSALRAEWARQAQSDRQMGGERFPETMRLANVALNAGGAPKGSEARKLLDQSGLGNHPAVIRLFRRLGEQLETKSRAKPAKPSKDRLEALYPDD